MSRMIDEVYRQGLPCCPGHDLYPRDSYNSRRSKKARARDKKASQQHARAIRRRLMRFEMDE